MSHFKFEGAVEGVSARQIEYISKILEDRGYTNEKVLIEVVGKPGDNYVANVKRIIIEKDDKKFSMIAKIAPTSEGMRMTMNSKVMFNNEHVMYIDVLPKFTDLEISAGIPEKERLRYAECYGTLLEEPNEIILLEDLGMSNFVMMDRFVSLTDDAVKLVLKNFAMLHAVGYALRAQEPETFAMFSQKLINMWAIMTSIPEMKMYFESMENDVLQIITDAKYQKYLKRCLSNMLIHGAKAAKVDLASRYSIIQQGDAWTNNIMFTLEEDKPVSCCMIDYQVSKQSSPVADLHYMIFNCTDHATRSKHYNDWIDYYHNELEKALSNYGLKANFVYPRDQLDADSRRYGKTSFGTSILLATVLIRESTDAAKMKAAMEEAFSPEGRPTEEIMEQSKISATGADTILRFKTRVEGLIDSFLEQGLI